MHANTTSRVSRGLTPAVQNAAMLHTGFSPMTAPAGPGECFKINQPWPPAAGPMAGPAAPPNSGFQVNQPWTAQQLQAMQQLAAMQYHAQALPPLPVSPTGVMSPGRSPLPVGLPGHRGVIVAGLAIVTPETNAQVQNCFNAQCPQGVTWSPSPGMSPFFYTHPQSLNSPPARVQSPSSPPGTQGGYVGQPQGSYLPQSVTPTRLPTSHTYPNIMQIPMTQPTYQLLIGDTHPVNQGVVPLHSQQQASWISRPETYPQSSPATQQRPQPRNTKSTRPSYATITQSKAGKATARGEGGNTIRLNRHNTEKTSPDCMRLNRQNQKTTNPKINSRHKSNDEMDRLAVPPRVGRRGSDVSSAGSVGPARSISNESAASVGTDSLDNVLKQVRTSEVDSIRDELDSCGNMLIQMQKEKGWDMVPEVPGFQLTLTPCDSDSSNNSALTPPDSPRTKKYGNVTAELRQFYDVNKGRANRNRRRRLNQRIRRAREENERRQNCAEGRRAPHLDKVHIDNIVTRPGRRSTVDSWTMRTPPGFAKEPSYQPSHC